MELNKNTVDTDLVARTVPMSDGYDLTTFTNLEPDTGSCIGKIPPVVELSFGHILKGKVADASFGDVTVLLNVL